MSAKTAFTILMCVCFLPAAARGETFELANGGKLQGVWLNPDESPRQSFDVQLIEGAVVSLAPGQVLRVAEKSEAELWYEEARKTMSPDIDGHLAIAAQCKTKRLNAQRAFHLQEVLKLDPDNVTARRELGFSKLDGEWVNMDVWHRERGYVKHKGTWMLPQEIEISKAEQEQEAKFFEWNKQIRQWRGWVLKQRDRADEGLRNILSIDDVAAAPVLAKLLDEKNEPPALKRAYLTVLGRLPGASSSVALVRRALNDKDPQVREEAVDQLAKRRDRYAVRMFVQVLRRAADENTPSEQNVLVNLAAAALARMQDPSATVALIDALVTKHKFVITPGRSGLNPVFSKSPNQPGMGVGGLNMGGRPEIVLRDISNETVRDALIVLHPGINFGFDEASWKRWFEQQRTPAVVDLRRDIE